MNRPEVVPLALWPDRGSATRSNFVQPGRADIVERLEMLTPLRLTEPGSEDRQAVSPRETPHQHPTGSCSLSSSKSNRPLPMNRPEVVPLALWPDRGSATRSNFVQPGRTDIVERLEMSTPLRLTEPRSKDRQGVSPRETPHPGRIGSWTVGRSERNRKLPMNLPSGAPDVPAGSLGPLDIRDGCDRGTGRAATGSSPQCATQASWGIDGKE
jgi:hypothetical protein